MGDVTHWYVGYFAALDSISEEIASVIDLDGIVTGTVGAMTFSVSVGYVFVTIRGGYLLTSLLASMPAWRLVDPLPVLTYLDEPDFGVTGGEDEESLESMVRDAAKQDSVETQNDSEASEENHVS